MPDHTRRDGTPIDYPARYVRPIDPLMLYRIMDRKPAPRMVANDVGSSKREGVFILIGALCAVVVGLVTAWMQGVAL